MHPDSITEEKAKLTKQFQALATAWDALHYPEKRAEYDALLAMKSAYASLDELARDLGRRSYGESGHESVHL